MSRQNTGVETSNKDVNYSHLDFNSTSLGCAIPRYVPIDGTRCGVSDEGEYKSGGSLVTKKQSTGALQLVLLTAVFLGHMSRKYRFLG